MDYSDQTFVLQFEQKTLPPEEFKHRDHLRLAWLYLNQYPLKAAIEKTTQGIEAYATNLGASRKFHHTLTEAILRIMHARLQLNSPKSFEGFLQENQDLIESFRDVLYTYYSHERLDSEAAKQHFVPPDLKHFNPSLDQNDSS